MFPYAEEQFTPDEEAILRRYVTNLHLPVFALVNLPEVVKGALFARYSRSPKSLRRLFLDEFVGDLDISGDLSLDATVGLERAEQLYEKVFVEYGDDSVAQLGGVHLACEQSSNVLSKVLEWGRLMSYLEQSTRYIAYDNRLESGHYRYFRPPEILDSPYGARYVGDMDRMFDTYGGLLPIMRARVTQRFPQQAGDTDFVYRQAVKAKSLDALRGLLPAASLSNIGLYGTGSVLRAAAAADAGPPAARGAQLRRHDADRAAQGHPLLPPAGRCGRAGRGVDLLSGLHPRCHGTGRRAPVARVRLRRARLDRVARRRVARARGHLARLRSRRGGKSAGGGLLQPFALFGARGGAGASVCSAMTNGWPCWRRTSVIDGTAATVRDALSSEPTTASNW